MREIEVLIETITSLSSDLRQAQYEEKEALRIHNDAKLMVSGLEVALIEAAQSLVSAERSLR